MNVDIEDELRMMLSKDLQQAGVPAASLHSMFEAIERPASQGAKPWAWLRTSEAREEGALLVLVGDPASTAGICYLATFNDGKRWLGNRTALVIDVNSYIRELEARTGQQFGLETTATDPWLDEDVGDDLPF
jgi:hypothetical protein